MFRMPLSALALVAALSGPGAGCSVGVAGAPADADSGPDDQGPGEPGPDDKGAPGDDAGWAAGPDAGPGPILDAGPGGAASDAGSPSPDGGHEPAGPDAGPIPPADAGIAPDVDAGPAPTGIGPTCFAEIFDPSVPGPDYDQYEPVVGGHCEGTQHQSITGVERVVFLGDSVTVGTPPTESADYYRSRLADELAERFDLEPPSVFWRMADPLEGTAGTLSSGDFYSCAKWGARTDDLMADNSQVLDCFPAAERDKKTLVIMTVGGNDLASITKAGPEGEPLEDIWAETEQFVADLRAAVEWMTDPQNVPGGTYVVFANMFEFTDGTGEIDSCASASLAGFGEPWENPADLEAMVVWATEQYMEIAVDTATDMIFMLERFCGHGFNYDDPEGRCYRGPDAERWFDLTCIHPNPTGHEVIADMFLSVVDG